MKVSTPAPPMRNVAQEANDTLQTQINLAPAQLDAYRQTAPGYDQVDLQRLRDALGISGNANLLDINNQLTGLANQQTIESNRSLREADLRDVQQLGTAARDAAMSANPDLWHAIGRVDAAAGQGAGSNPYQTLFGSMAQQSPGGVREWATINPERVNAPSIGGGYGVGATNWGTAYMADRGIAPDVRNVSSGAAPQVAARSSIGIRSSPLSSPTVSTTSVVSPAGVSAPTVERAMLTGAQNVYAPSSIVGLGVNAASVGVPTPSALSSSINRNALLGGPTSVESTLMGQAQRDLNLGTQLSPEELRQVQQASRAAYAARGLQDSNSALADEAVQTYQMGQQRYRERQQAAGDINSLFRSGQAADRGYGLSAEGLNQSYGSQALQAALANQQSSMQAQMANQSDLTARSSLAANLGVEAQKANQTAQLQAQLANQGTDAERAALQAQLGMQAGLANQSTSMQAAMANAAARNAAYSQQANLQNATDQLNTQNYQWAIGQAMQDEYNRAIANQQAQLQAQGYGLEAQRANQSAALQGSQLSMADTLARAQANAAADNENRRQLAALQLQAGSLNQQDAYNRAALGAQLGLQAQLANQQAGNAAQQYNSEYWREADVLNNQLRQQQMGNLAQAAGMQQSQNDTAFNRLLAAAQARQSTYQDPYLAILGRQSSNVGTNAGLMGMGQGAIGANSGVRSMFDPFNGYASDLYGSNQSAVYNTNIANTNARAGILSGLFQGLGSAAGGYFGR